MTLAKLGFGTSQLMGRIGRKRSLRLMETAFDAGICHFDTAPLYGFGAAEGMVGEFAAGKRADVVITTKFGLRPPAASPWMGPVKACARVAVKAIPSLRSKLRRRAEGAIIRGIFTREECAESLRVSLRQLRTEYIDLFLMHEVLPDQVTGELLAALEYAALAGGIKKFGIATSGIATTTIARTMRPGTVAQFPSNLFAPVVKLVPDHLEKITHSAISGGFRGLCDELIKNVTMRKQWSEILDLDCADRDELGRLFLFGAMTENPGGTVVFSSLSEGRIRRNASLMHDHRFSPEQVRLLHDLIHGKTIEAGNFQELTA